MTESEFISKLFENLIPLALGGLLTALGVVLGFVFSEILTGRRVAILLVVFGIMLAVSSSLAGWATLAVFVTMFSWTVFRYLVGPRRRPMIVFAGFYDSSGKAGYFSRTGLSKLTDASFVKTLQETFSKSGLSEVRPVSIVSHKPPALIHRFCDHDRFHKLALQYAGKGLGTIWGTVDAEGVPRNIEVILNLAEYHGRGSAQDIVNEALGVLNLTAIRPEEKIRFVASILGAIWGNSSSNDLASGGQWRRALAITDECKRLMEHAFDLLESQLEGDGRNTIEKMKASLLPTIQVEEARNRLYGEQWEEAFEQLVRTLEQNPLYPFHDFNEFKRFFVARYSLETTAYGPYTDDAIARRIDELAEVAQLHTAPHLQLLIDWIIGAGVHVPNLQEHIDGWFVRLNHRFPENPFILLFWGDAIKIPARLGLRPDLKPGPDDKLPLEIIDAALKKYEAALTLAPDIHIISTKIAMNYWVTAHYFSKLSLDHRVRMKKFDQHSAKARIHMTDTEPNFNRESDLDWSKYGLTSELVDQLMTYVADKKEH